MKVLYQCEFCSSIYETEEEAKKCEAQGMPEPKFDRGYKFGIFEVRRRKLRAVDGKHIWYYDARRAGEDEEIYQYGEFLESEIEEFK